MATFNKYTAIFNKLKSIFERDSRTSQFAVYGGEYSKNKQFPCILVFPGSKIINEEDNQRSNKKYGSVKQVEYNYSIWCYTHLMEVEDSYYNNTNDNKAGITQVMTEVEAVLKDNPTGNDLVDTTVQLWYDMIFDKVEITPKYAKLMYGLIQVTLLAKEQD